MYLLVIQHKEDITNVMSVWIPHCPLFQELYFLWEFFACLCQKQGGWNCTSSCQWTCVITRLFTILMEPAGKLWWRYRHGGFRVGKAALPHSFTIHSGSEHQVTTAQFKHKYYLVWDCECRWVNLACVLAVGVYIRGIYFVYFIGYRV